MVSQILNKDCFEGMKEMRPQIVDLLVTDPPYGMSFRSNHRKDKFDNIVNDQNLDWLPAWTKLTKRVMKEDAHGYVFCSHHNISMFMSELSKQFNIKNLLVWEKNNHGSGDLLGDYAPKYELIIFLSNGKKKLNGPREPNVIKTPKSHNEVHPTQKPLFLLKYLIRKSSEKNDLIFDPFMGSGSTAVAAKQEGREYFGYEIDSQYHQTCLNRIINEGGVMSLF